MAQVLEGWARLLSGIGRAERLAAGLILSAVVGAILVQVALAAGLGRPILWEQEGGAYALVWLTFLGASVGLKQMRHVAIVSVVTAAPNVVQATLRIVGWLVILWLLWRLMIELVPVIEIESRANTVALPVDLPRSWFFSVPLIITSASMMLTALYYLTCNAMRLIGIAVGDPPPVMRGANREIDA